MLDVFLKRGFTYFDTAYMYHDYTSENFINKCLVQRYPRERFLLATKLPMSYLNYKNDQEWIFNGQLEKCGVQYFDYYLFHTLNIANYRVAEKLDSFNFIKEKMVEGKVKHIGFSFHDNPELLDEILSNHPEIEFVQFRINYLDWR